MLGVQEVIGSTAEVVVSHCTSWKQFWVQRRSEEVAQLAAQLDTTDPAVLGSPLTSPQVATCPLSSLRFPNSCFVPNSTGTVTPVEKKISFLLLE